MLANQIGLSNKVVSERHHFASQTKLTAGEAAKKISKSLKIKVTAKEVQAHCTEWHHSGFYKAGGKSSMGRTWFISFEEVEKLIANWSTLKAELVARKEVEEIEKQRLAAEITQGFYFTWDYDYSGSYGKKRNFKRLQWYSGSKLKAPKNMTETSVEFYEKNKEVKRNYYGWDEPKITDF